MKKLTRSLSLIPLLFMSQPIGAEVSDKCPQFVSTISEEGFRPLGQSDAILKLFAFIFVYSAVFFILGFIQKKFHRKKLYYIPLLLGVFSLILTILSLLDDVCGHGWNELPAGLFYIELTQTVLQILIPAVAFFFMRRSENDKKTTPN